MSSAVSVVVAGDHSIYRAGVLQCLALDPAIEVVGEASCAADAIEIVRRENPRVALLDLSMPGGGLEAAQIIATDFPATRVAILTVSENDNDVLRAVESGVAGYLLKGIEALQLVSAIKIISDGGAYMSPGLGLRLLSATKRASNSPEQVALSSLSEQEQRVLRLVAQGKSNRDIAMIIGIQESTAKFHVARILAKLSLKNRVEAAVLARTHWDLP